MKQRPGRGGWVLDVRGDTRHKEHLGENHSHRIASQADSAGSIPVTRFTRETPCRSWGLTNSTSPLSIGLGPGQSTVNDPCAIRGPQTPCQHPPSGPTTLDLHGFSDLVDPRVDRGDSLLERSVHARAGPCGREVGPPVLMRDNYAGPGPFGPSERTGIVSTCRKDCLRSNPKFEQRRAAFRADQVTAARGRRRRGAGR